MEYHSAMSSVQRSLQDTFGLEKLRPGQAEVIRCVLDGKDILALMPTGAGKSLCYQLPALQLKGVTVIVSPLIALMKDQVDKLRELGLDAVELNSTVTGRHEAAAMEQIEDEQSEFLFTTPERLAEPEFLDALKDATIDFVVIDEAHCISQWGHDFRPAYLAIRQALRDLGDPPLLALTATATEEVLDDIREQLGRPKMRIFNAGIYRPNLMFAVEHVSGDAEKHAAMTRLLKETEGTGIVYAATIRHVDELAAHLQAAGLSVEAYHGKQPDNLRAAAQERFMAGELRAMIATNAFGLGIDKPDIRFVVHYDLPGSLEAYYQEAGRAGRDGELARCTLLYDRKDRRTQLFFLGGKYPDPEDILAVYRALETRARNERGATVTEIRKRAPDVALKKIRVVLSLLKEAGLAQEPRASHFTAGRRKPKKGEIDTLSAAYRERGERDREKLERMEEYARRAACRWTILHEYFGEDMPEPLCGTCDNCRRGIAERASSTAA